MTQESFRRWLPLILSATAWPGAGQFMQKRKFWGAVYASGFTLFTGIFFVLLFPVLKRLLDAWLGGPPPDPVNWKQVLRPLAVALGIYAANLYDVWWNTLKASRPPPLPPRA